MFRSLLQTAKVATTLNLQPCPHCMQRLVPASLSVPSVRTAITVERVNPVPLHQSSKQPRLKTRHYIYKEVRNDDFSPFRVQAKIIMIKDGSRDTDMKAGDVLEVKQGKFYRELLPFGEAVFATETNLELYDDLIQKRALTAEISKQETQIVLAEQTARTLTRMCLPIALNATTDTVLTPAHVMVALWKAGIEVIEESAIMMPEEPVTGAEEFTLSLKINGKYTAPFTGVIYRVTNDNDHLIPDRFDDFLQHRSTDDSAQVIIDETVENIQNNANDDQESDTNVAEDFDDDDDDDDDGSKMK